MQSIFRLPWCSEHSTPKVAPAAYAKPWSPPMVEIPVVNMLKRKRTSSEETPGPSRPHLDRQQRSDDSKVRVTPTADTPAPSQLSAREAHPTSALGKAHELKAQPNCPQVLSSTTAHSAADLPQNSMEPSADPKRPHSVDDASPLQQIEATSEPEMGLSRLQQVIENEFNMQILMKHDELRLIEQELAKCQIALEQLRRVELRPFPGANDVSEDISSGTGPAVAPMFGGVYPSHPASYGVTDGPYTHHYQQWLLHHPLFDHAPPQMSVNAETFGHSVNRSTRTGSSTRKSVSKGFVFPGRPADTLQSIPNYPAAPTKDKTASLILKRSTDNQYVKLICNDCLRGNFSSIQGFLNHCRIAHKVDYKSHDAAAVDCGRLLDEHEVANIPLEIQNAPATKPATQRASIASSTPCQSLVHPLNAVSDSPSVSRAASRKSQPLIPARSLNASVASKTNERTLVRSSQIPRLSAHFAKYKLGGDLAAAAASAKQKIELGADDDMLSPHTSEKSSPLESPPSGQGFSIDGRASMTLMPTSTQRPLSRKGYRQPASQRPRPSPLAPTPNSSVVKQEDSEMLDSPQFNSSTLSPQTVDGNPGLVSDHEDDDHGSASEEEAPHADIRPFPVARNCADNVGIEVEEDHEVEQSGIRIRQNSLFAEYRAEAAGKLGGRKVGN